MVSKTARAAAARGSSRPRRAAGTARPGRRARRRTASDQRVGEEDRVVEERLRQSSARGRARRAAVVCGHRTGRSRAKPSRSAPRSITIGAPCGSADRRAACDLRARCRRRPARPRRAGRAEQPARALRDVAADEDDGEPEQRRRAERRARQPRAIAKHRGSSSSERASAERGAHPVAAVDREVGPPRTRAGISSSMAELIAAYSPPMAAPVRKRKMAKLRSPRRAPQRACRPGRRRASPGRASCGRGGR